MNIRNRLSFPVLLLLTGCSSPLKRPVVSGAPLPLASFYILEENPERLEKTADCEKYLKRADRDSLRTAICHLNLGKTHESRVSASRIADSCFRGILEYDILVEEQKLSKPRRFERLQSLLECSADPAIRSMIQVRSKLVHYEAE